MRTRHLITGITFIAAITLSCCGQKAITEETNKITEMKDNKFKKEGYTSGTIVQSKAEGDCEWSIKLADGRYFESKDMSKEFMVNNLEVWFKYTPQRRMQVCDKASPVSINTMVKK